MKKIAVLLLCILFSTQALAKKEDKPKKLKKLPPGLEKKYQRTGELPPGWHKKLVKGEVLDSDLYNAGILIENFPPGYKIEPKAGTELLRIEDRIIRIKKDTKEILEILGIEIH